MTALTLTRDDLERALEDERHMGFGFSQMRHLPVDRGEQMAQAVVDRANELGLDYEALFQWTNHKNGRWTCDSATDLEKPAADIVRDLMPPPCDKCGGHGCGWCD